MTSTIATAESLLYKILSKMSSFLGLRTDSGLPSVRAATSAVPRNVEPVPLAHSTIASTLQFLIPPSIHGIPSSIISRQLRNRHHFLSITPDQAAAYFCLNPEHPSQDTSKVLSTLHELADQNMEDLARSIRYSTDGEDLLSHVITAEPGSIQVVFIWETPDANDSSNKTEWKYLDVKPFLSSDSLYSTLQAAEEARLKANSKSSLTRQASGNSIADDSYWSAYGNVAPSVSNGRAAFLNGLIRNESGTGLSRGSVSPRREEAYWDRYGYDSDEDEGGGAPVPIVAPPPAAEAEPRTLGHAQIWNASAARFSPEALSEALAMHLQPELPSSTITQDLAVSLNTPPQKQILVQPASEPASPLQAPSFSDISVEQDTSSAVGSNAASTGEKAVADATRGIYNLWRNTRNSQGSEDTSSSEEKKAFLELVTRALADL